MQICTCTTIKGVLTVHIIQIWKKNNRWFSPLDLHQPIQKLLQAFLNHAIKNAWTQDHEAVLYLSQNLYTVWLSSSFSTQNHRRFKIACLHLYVLYNNIAKANSWYILRFPWKKMKIWQSWGQRIHL